VKTEQAEIYRILGCTGGQVKLTIGQTDDKYGQEADRIAEQITRKSSPTCSECLGKENFSKVQRQIKEKEKFAQTKPDSGQNSYQDVISRAQIHSASCSGQPLPQSTQDFFESRFGRDFSDVRVHTCKDSVQMSKELYAHAFTYGSNIYFNEGKYNPHTSEGKRLLAHELMHVIQQRHPCIGPNMAAIQRRTYRYCREVETGNTVMDTLAGILGLEHCWLKTDTKAAGMGPAQAGPLPAWPFGIPTKITDHSQDAHTDSTEIHGVDENCVNQELEIGKSTGAWGIDNNCNTFVDDVIATCRERRRELDRQFVRSGTFGIESSGGADPVNIAAGNKPYFVVRPLPAQHSLRFRWIIADDQDRRYLMWGDQGSVFRYGSQYSAYIPSRTRALLRERNIRTATVLCRVIGGGADRLTRLPVRFVW
jgi:hypothetical protein